MLYEGTESLRFQTVNDTQLIQACARSEPSGRCSLGDKLIPSAEARLRAARQLCRVWFQRAALSCEYFESPNMICCVCVPAEKASCFTSHLELVRPCYAWGNRVCPSGQESSGSLKGYRRCFDSLCCIAGFLPLGLDDSITILGRA